MQNIYAYYINVFRDTKGVIRESEGGLLDTEAKALAEAVEYVLDFHWEYVDTLSNYAQRVDFRDAIADARFGREHPDCELTRTQWENMQRAQLARLGGQEFRPQPSRGTAPSNPATLAARGEL